MSAKNSELTLFLRFGNAQKYLNQFPIIKRDCNYHDSYILIITTIR